MGSAEYKAYRAQIAEYVLSKTTLVQIMTAIQTLADILDRDDEESNEHRKFYESELNRFSDIGPLTLNRESPEEYLNELERANRRAGGLRIRVGLLEKRIESAKHKFETDERKPDLQYFESLLVTLSDAAGYHIPDSIPVSQFCERVRRLSKTSASPNKKGK